MLFWIFRFYNGSVTINNVVFLLVGYRPLIAESIFRTCLILRICMQTNNATNVLVKFNELKNKAITKPPIEMIKLSLFIEKAIFRTITGDDDTQLLRIKVKKKTKLSYEIIFTINFVMPRTTITIIIQFQTIL